MTEGSASLPRLLHVLVPFWGMAGGVIKVLDYASHASNAGIDVRIWAPALPPPTAAVCSLPVFDALGRASNVEFRRIDDVSFDGAPDPWVLFTEPAHHALIEQNAEGSLGQHIIHLIQGTRHANPSWNGGLHYRLLHRPMTRIAVTEQVAEAIRPHVNTRFALHVIREGHDIAYFRDGAPDRTPHGGPLRVLYTNWKSDLGDRVAHALTDNAALVFDAISTECTWDELRRRYHAADIFMCTPGPEEGFYLPGLEAMAAGCVVVSAFVGGNEAYLIDGVNCIRTPHDDAHAHAVALAGLASDRSRHSPLIAAGSQTITDHTLERERDEFINHLRRLSLPNSDAELT